MADGAAVIAIARALHGEGEDPRRREAGAVPRTARACHGGPCTRSARLAGCPTRLLLSSKLASPAPEASFTTRRSPRSPEIKTAAQDGKFPARHRNYARTADPPQLPLGLLNAAQGHPMLVELKNGETLNGHLVQCDTWMNLTLKEVVQTSPVGAPDGWAAVGVC